MKKFCFKTILFILPIIGVLSLMEIALRIIPNDYAYKKKKLLENCSSIQTLILGGSHAYYDIDPSLINTTTFNLAYVSQPLIMDYALLQQNYSSMPNLKNVILTIAYPTLSSNLDLGEFNWRQYYYYRYWGVGDRFNSLSIKTISEVAHLRVKRSLEKIFNYLKDPDGMITCSPLGWGDNYLWQESKDLKESSLLAYQRHEDNSMDFSENLKVLEDIIDLCRLRDINVYIISFPVYNDYYKQLKLNKVQKITHSIMDIVDEKENVWYLNFSQDNRFTDGDFYDADHLNNLGAKKFSMILGDTLTIYTALIGE